MPEHYLCVIYKDADTDYGVIFPDLPGCIAASGESLEGALTEAGEALALHLEGLVNDGLEFPEASSYEELPREYNCPNVVVALVPVPVLRPKSVRVNVTLPEDLLAAIDRRVGPGERSGVLAEAAREKLVDGG